MNVVSLISDDDDDDDSMVEATPVAAAAAAAAAVASSAAAPPGSRRAARKRRLAEAGISVMEVSPSSSTAATSFITTPAIGSRTPVATHVRSCVESENYGKQTASVYDPFLIPTISNNQKTTANSQKEMDAIQQKQQQQQQHMTWEELRSMLTDNDYVVLSSHALISYEKNSDASVAPPAKKTKKNTHATSSTSDVYTKLQAIIPKLVALQRHKDSVAVIPQVGASKTNSSAKTKTKAQASASSSGPNYWKAGTGYGGGNHQSSDDMSATFVAQSEAHLRQAKEDTTDKALLDTALATLNTHTDLLLHPVVSGAILRDLVPRCTNYLSTSFDDMCERESLFTTVLKLIMFLNVQGRVCSHIMQVAPDEVAGKKQQDDDDTPPPPSIAQLLDILDRQASVFAAALGGRKNSNEAKSCLRLTAAISACKNNVGESSDCESKAGRGRKGAGKGKGKGKGRLADAVTSSSGGSGRSGGGTGGGCGSGGGGGGVEAVDLTSRSGAQQDSYVAVMNSMKIKTAPLLDGGKYPYTYRAQVKSVKTSVQKRLIRIGKELASLSNSLPIHDTSSVMVCIDEDRPDCLKAMIVGPAGTPYENGLFEFDIFLPADYPNSPPKVILVTTGCGQIRFNPNLYAEGKVCLSLLGTWRGPGWHPKCTLLQVLISIQSLILVDEPFFNEPGFEKHQGTESGVSSNTCSCCYFCVVWISLSFFLDEKKLIIYSCSCSCSCS